MKEMTDATWDVSGPVVLVEACSKWCGPCRKMAPLVEELDVEMGGRVEFRRADGDVCANSLTDIGIKSVPTFALFVDGEEQARWIGAMEKRKLKSAIEGVLSAMRIP
jgi:thioredoxin 1